MAQEKRVHVDATARLGGVVGVEYVAHYFGRAIVASLFSRRHGRRAEIDTGVTVACPGEARHGLLC